MRFISPKKALPLVLFTSSLTLTASLQANTMLGAYVDHDGWSVETIDQFNADSAKPMAVVNLFTTFDNHWDSLTTQAGNVVSRGAMPMVTWMPYSKDTPDMLSAIASGEQNAYITSWIDSFKAWRDSYPADQQPTIMLRFGHEFNGNWYPWGNQPEALKAAWRHLHALFEQAGINNSVEWVWCANNVDVDDVGDVTRYYPGDDVVDWTSIDGYNWGSNFSFTQWKSFDETFSAAYVKLVTEYPDKPLVIAEVGSAEPGDVPNSTLGQDGDDTDASEDKDAWVTDMYSKIMADYPAIRAVAWFNTNKELSWALNGTAHSGFPNTGMTGYNQTVAQAHYTSTFTPLKQDVPTSDDPVNNNKGGKDKTESTTGAGKKGGKKPASSTTIDVMATQHQSPSDYALTGIEKAIDVSRMPAVVGERLLAREAAGLRALPPEAIDAWRSGRLGSE